MAIVRERLSFPMQLKLLRVANGWSQREIAARTGIALIRVWEIENKHRAPTAEEKAKIFHALSTGDDE